MSSWIVVKIGGSTLSSANSYFNHASEIRALIEHGVKPFIVLSAMKGVTDSLLRLASGRIGELEFLRDLHYSVALELGGARLASVVDGILGKLGGTASTVSRAPALVDYIVSYGERLSRVFMVKALEAEGVRVLNVSALDVIAVNGGYGDAYIDYGVTFMNLAKVRELAEAEGASPVVEGFIGRMGDGTIATLGRGGSDYTATAVASLLGISSVFMVTDVPGIFSCDPRIVSGVRLVGELSLREAREASLYNVKGLNPKAFAPELFNDRMEIRIGTWSSRGTLVKARAREGAKLVGYKGSTIALIGEGAQRVKVAAKLLEALDAKGVPVYSLEFASEKPSISFRVPENLTSKALNLAHKVVVDG
ncbi:MAG: hypothetical protein ACK4H7_01140 [Acidilobaceae archaeon]